MTSSSQAWKRPKSPSAGARSLISHLQPGPKKLFLGARSSSRRCLPAIAGAMKILCVSVPPPYIRRSSPPRAGKIVNGTMATQDLEADREATNPLFNDRKLKLGTLGTNLSSACAISTIDGVFETPGPTRWRWRNWPMRWSSRPWYRSGAGAASAARPISTGSRSRPIPGRPASARPREIPPCSRRPRPHRASHHGRQAGHHDRSYYRRAVRPQHRLRLVRAPSSRCSAPRSWITRPVTTTPRMDHDHQAVVDGGGRVRLRRQILHDQERLPPTQAGPETISRCDERRRFRARHAFRRQTLRYLLHRLEGPRHRRGQGLVESYRRLAREEYGREIQIWNSAYIVQRDTEKEARDYLGLLCAREGRLGRGREPGQNHGRPYANQDAREPQKFQVPFPRRLGRLSPGRYQGPDRPRAWRPCPRSGWTGRS